MPIANTDKLQMGLFMCKSHKQLLPGSFASGSIKNYKVHGQQISSYNKYHHIEVCSSGLNKSAYTCRCIRKYGPVFWNCLPLDVTNLPNCHLFKSALIVYLMKTVNTQT